MQPEDMSKEQLLDLLYEICVDHYLEICPKCGTVNKKEYICSHCGLDTTE